MEITDVINGLKVLQHYTNAVYLDYVPEATKGGQPKHPFCLFLRVEIDGDFKSEDTNALREFGWRNECDGMYWVFYDQ